MSEKTSTNDRFGELCLRLSEDFGFEFIDIYAPNDEVVGILFSKSEELIDAFQEIELEYDSLIGSKTNE